MLVTPTYYHILIDSVPQFPLIEDSSEATKLVAELRDDGWNAEIGLGVVANTRQIPSHMIPIAQLWLSVYLKQRSQG